MGFGDRTGIDLGHEVKPVWPANTAYYDRLRGPRGWTNAVTLNLAIGQGENTQTVINMMRFYAALAGNGTLAAPYLVRRADSTTISLGLDSAQLAGIREALSDVVQRGTAAASGGREINMAGKTGTAQNPHGPDHGWFIGFAPADHPQIVVGSIMEFKLHGSLVAPYVAQVIRHYLTERNPAMAKAPVRFPVVEDSVIGPVDLGPDSLRPDTARSNRPPRAGGVIRPR